MKLLSSSSFSKTRTSCWSTPFFCVGIYVTFLSRTTPAYGMVASPTAFTESQPDGTVITLQINGDSYDAWISDVDGYTVLKDPITQRFVYAEPDGMGGLQASNEDVVTKSLHKYPAPVSNTVSAGINIMKMNHLATATAHDDDDDDQNGLDDDRMITHQPRKKESNKQKRLRPTYRDCSGKICGDQTINDSRSTRLLRVRGGANKDPLHPTTTSRSLPSSNTNTNHSGSNRRTLRATTGTLRNLVILLKWSDHVNRTLPTQSDVDILMNHEGIHTRCPTGSVRDVFLQNSYGKLRLESTVLDWITMDNTEQYYSNGERGVTTLIRDAIMYALHYIDENELVDFSYFDADQDGVIDSITFIHSGYGAEWGGTDEDGRYFEDRIWSHKWQLLDYGFVSKDGVTVKDYHISPSLWGTQGSAMGRIGVIAHETGHFLGMPDLYDVDGGGQGLGMYCLMANSWGYDGSQYYPPHMSALVKLALGWIEPVQPSIGINHIEATQVQEPTYPQVYTITEGFPDGEFLLIENRQRIGLDSRIPQGGIFIWHIDYTTDPTSLFMDSLSNEGHPWQEGWPQNGNHYGIALLQADGLYELERGLSNGEGDDVFHAAGVDELVPCTIPDECQYPNTDSYQGGIINRTNVYITNIGRSQSIMSFTYNVIETSQTPTISPSLSIPSEAPTTMELVNDRVPPLHSSEPSDSIFSLQKSTIMALATILAGAVLGLFL